MFNKKFKKYICISVGIVGTSFVGLKALAKYKKGSYIYQNSLKEQNPFEGKKVIFVNDENVKENADGVSGYLEGIGDSDFVPSFYDKYIKRTMDVVLSFGGLVVLSPVFAGVALAIMIEDPGPVFFTQKRVGQNKKYFTLHKFRSMKLSTPHDVPTHQLENPEQYITKIGKFIRAHSLDELPQIWDIFVGNMSVIGPRPALWNQDLLIAERDKYNANDVKPGLTGWAQINGRDELEIEEKARLDGEYVQKESLLFDTKCFIGTISKVGHDDSVVEGGTREMSEKKKWDFTTGKSKEELIGNIGFGEPVEVDRTQVKKVLITGAGSYIGEAFENYTRENYADNFQIDTVDMLDDIWRTKDFSKYDIVYHVAGIAHADVGNVSDDVKQKYYEINTGLTLEVAEKAKKEGVKEFVFMSSMIVYGDSAPFGKKKVVDETTLPVPANFYGNSKFQADVAVREMADEKFKVIVLRPPMIYGKGSKGNYPILAKMARKLPVFPEVINERSMLHIDNLCEFLCQIMLIKLFTLEAVVLIPQNPAWTKTSDMVKKIAEVSGKRIITTKLFTPAIKLCGKIPGKISDLVNKAFGNSTYALAMSQYEGIDYQVVDFEASIERTESNEKKKDEKPKALIVASVASMIDQFNMQNIELLLEKGYDVDVACNCKEGNTISDERIKALIEKLKLKNVKVYHIPIPRKISNIKGIKTSITEIRKMCKKNGYTLMHCHSPIGSVVARIAACNARKKGMKVIYTAHGFHFYKGAPKKNWLVFYPIEKMCSKLTDVLITINQEDYIFAKKHMKAKKIEYIPGVGIDIKKFNNGEFDRAAKRKELGLDADDIMLLSVGELNQNKNHEVIIKAIGALENQNIHYFIAGKGDKEEFLKKLSEQKNVKLHLLGYRTDISELYNSADIFVFPSIREGLSVSLMEAMASGLPCIVSKIRGNVDLIEEGKSGYLCNPMNEEKFRKKINELANDKIKRKEFGKRNQSKAEKYKIEEVLNRTKLIYF